MKSFYEKKSGKRTKVIIAVGVVLVFILVVVVGWLIVRVTHDQPQTVVYKDEKDDGNGLSTSGDSGNGLSLQGLPLPGQENSQSGSSSSASSSSGSGSAAVSNGGTSSGSSGSTANTQQPVRSQTLPNGLKIEEYNAGSGSRTTKVGDTVVVHYVGYLPNGTVFDTSLKGQKQPFAFKLGAGKVIAGWDIGLQDMKIGAIRRLTIPAALAYGAKGSPPAIPPNTPLIFDTQLMGIQ